MLLALHQVKTDLIFGVCNGQRTTSITLLLQAQHSSNNATGVMVLKAARLL